LREIILDSFSVSNSSPDCEHPTKNKTANMNTLGITLFYLTINLETEELELVSTVRMYIPEESA